MCCLCQHHRRTGIGREQLRRSRSQHAHLSTDGQSLGSQSVTNSVHLDVFVPLRYFFATSLPCLIYLRCTLACLFLPYLAVFYLPYPALPKLPYLIYLPYITLLYVTLPYFTLYYHTQLYCNLLYLSVVTASFLSLPQVTYPFLHHLNQWCAPLSQPSWSLDCLQAVFIPSGQRLVSTLQVHLCLGRPTDLFLLPGVMEIKPRSASMVLPTITSCKVSKLQNFRDVKREIQVRLPFEAMRRQRGKAGFVEESHLGRIGRGQIRIEILELGRVCFC